MSSIRKTDVFISLRYVEASTEADLLKAELEKKGLKVYICDPNPGDDMLEEISREIEGATLRVIMGSETFGEQTQSTFSTYEELQSILRLHKQKKMGFFIVKMCDEFKVATTRVSLPSNLSYIKWSAGHPMPDNLVQILSDKLAKAKESYGSNAGGAAGGGGAASGGSAGSSTVDGGLSTLLQQLDLSDAAEPLAKYGIKSVANFKKLNERMLKEMVADHGLTSFHKGLILDHVTQGPAPGSKGNNEELVDAGWKKDGLPRIKQLVGEGYDINSKDSDGDTALHYAAREGPAPGSKGNNKELVNAALKKDGLPRIKQLFGEGYDINSKKSDGFTALHYAAREGYNEIVDWLIGAKANVNAVNNFGNSPLHLSAHNGHAEATRMLLNARADTTLKNNQGKTALDRARDLGHTAVVAMLKK
eukprot:CAMPEP_0181321532 /NCGR_PEP_ID=MMETSP1101-20121128/18742_1 /TAXON_ID=46948 /ORGANISM="Rhodomonas abbreviata, Strain Caron Lab Isolate" /LENGTH=418 /DNA_ID=CAMNT_0023429379 /DNA_START=58 /DNA_END=1315 /DNA_ORIENTATION=-